MDGGVTDAATDGATDGGDASSGCTTDSQCPQGQICGLTQPGVCSPCGTDTQCQNDKTYGSGYICVGGACTAGNCHTDTDCPQGQICGVTQAHYCGKCTTDTQCKNDSTYGSGYVCNTTSGACVQNTCTAVNQTCPLNPGDECCAVSGSDICVAGDCCTNTQCSGGTPACEGYACTACDAVGSPWHYYVDPVNGSDGVGTTGSGTAAGQANSVCAFKTITAAIGYVLKQSGGTPNAGTEIIVKGPSTVSNATNGETFPIVVPANVLVKGDGVSTVTVDVTAGVEGFTLDTKSSGVASLIVDGQSNTATHGIHAGTGSASTVSGVTVQNFLDEGILVDGSGVLAITGGTQSIKNGTAALPNSGLHVTGSASATITGGTNGGPTAFSNNTQGILVDQTASIAVTGAAGSGGVGTVVANGNASDGVYISQSISTFPPTNTITGLVVWKSGANGIRIDGGSVLTLRSSYVLNNKGSGVLAEDNTAGTGSYANFSNIDLGKNSSTQWGLNTLQDSANPNASTGVCLATFATVGTNLNAAGNIFGTVNCSTTAGTLTFSQCNGASDVGSIGSAKNTITTSQCTCGTSMQCL